MHRSALGVRRLGTTLAAAALVTACALLPAAVRAEDGAPATSFEPDAPIVTAQRQTAQQRTRSGTEVRRAPRLEKWEITPTVQFTWSTGSDVLPPGGSQTQIGRPAGNTVPLDIVRLIGDARYRFNNHLGLKVQRISHTGAQGRQAPVAPSAKNPLGGTYSGQSTDIEERFLGEYVWNSDLDTVAGYARRWRDCCPASGAAGNLTPRSHSGFFTETAWRFGPNGGLGKPWRITGRWEEYRHLRAIPTPANDEGVKPTFNATFYSNIYLWHQNKLVPYAGLEYFSSYFNYSPQMSLTFRKVYGVSYRATRDLSYRAYVKTDQSVAAGPDANHKSTAFLEAGYRITPRLFGR